MCYCQRICNTAFNQDILSNCNCIVQFDIYKMYKTYKMYKFQDTDIASNFSLYTLYVCKSAFDGHSFVRSFHRTFSASHPTDSIVFLHNPCWV